MTREKPLKIALFYLKHGQKHDGSESLVRFDVFSIRISDGDNLIEHNAEALIEYYAGISQR